MRIALIVTDLSPLRIGGISKVATEIITHYLQKGHNVDVFCLKRTADFFFKQKGLRLITVSSPFQLYKDYPVVSFSVQAFYLLLKEHNINPYDVSHGMNFNNFGMPFFRGKLKKANLPHVSTAFETTEMEIKAKWAEFKSKPVFHCFAQIVMELFLAPWQKAYIGWADEITTEDSETKNNLIKKGIPEYKINLIPSGIDLVSVDKTIANLKKVKNKNLMLCCPGRVDARKGTQYLLRAFALFSKTNPNVELEFVGGGRGDYLEQMIELAKDLGISEKVYFRGKVDDILIYYAQSDFIVIPSLSEGIPITLQEALAFKKPILCSKLEGTYYYASSLPSVLWCEPGSVENIAKGLSYLVSQKFEEEVQIGRSFIEEYGWVNVANKYLKVYDKAIGNK